MKLFWLLSISVLFSGSVFANSRDFSSFDLPGSIKGTVRAKTVGADDESTLVSGASVRITNVNNPTFLLKTSTDDTGSFVFDNLPAGKYQIVIEASGLPTATRDIDLAAGATLVVDVDLDVSITETVTIRNEEGLLSTSETTTSNIVRTETLKTQPFREDEYESALPLTPGVVQDASNNAYVKGARSGQSNYTVNGADVTDPISGESAFEIPIEAVSNIQVEEDPYSAEYGSFTGGVTNLQSKGGGDKFKISVARLFPTLHNFFSAKIDSFRPRVTFSGPVLKERLHFLQSFEYRYRRDYVPDLVEPFDHTATERVSSFTQLDLKLNKNNQLKFNFAWFPQKVRFYGLNTFDHTDTTSNTKQRGFLLSLSEVVLFKNTSFLTSTASYKTSDLDVISQGSLAETIRSDVNSGNYFAELRRVSNRTQLQETYYAKPFEAAGKHAIKVGFEFDHTVIAQQFLYKPIFFRRLDGTLAQEIDFTAPGRHGFDFNEVSFFVHDRFTINPKVTLDFGLRYDYEGIDKNNNISPRFSVLFSPFKHGRTIIRGGVGIFFDRIVPAAGYFCPDCESGIPGFGASPVPERIVTKYATDGSTVIDGPRLFVNQLSGNIDSPRSVRWSIHVDQGITKDLTLRFGYLQRRTTNDLLVHPVETGPGTGSNILRSDGRSRYHEFQVLATYSPKRMGNWNVSYTYSKAQGDLNTAESIIGDFPTFNIRPNEFSVLPFDAPHRFLAYGQFELPFAIRVAPLFEYRTGFPFSAFDDRLEFVGSRNRAGRFPDYMSLDLQITKGFPVTFRKKKYGLRPGVALFDVTNHFNPRDVQGNINDPNFGKFYNSLGFGVKAKFDIEF